MKRNKPYGRAFKISREEASAYARTTRPRGYVPNPLGVTAMASVNGRGAYHRSVKSLARGMTQAERAERARTVLRNGENEMSKRAAFLRNPFISRHYRGHTSLATLAARLRRAEEALKEAETPAEKKAAKRAVATRRRQAVKKTPAQLKAANQRRGKRLAAYSAAKRQGLDEKKAARKAIKAVPLKSGETFKGIAASKTRRRNTKAKVQVGKVYRRERLVDPATGRARLSWMYRAKGGKLRKIPQADIIASRAMKAEKIVEARKKAAERILKSGSAFVANKRKGSKSKGKAKMTKKQRGKWLAAFNAARRAGKGKEAAKLAAFRAVGKKAAPKKAAKKAAKKTGKKAAKKAAVRRTGWTKAKRVAAAKKAARTRKRNLLAMAKPAKKGVKKAAKKSSRKSTGWTKAKRKAAGKKAAATRKRNAKAAGRKSGKKMRKNARTMSGYLSHSKTGQPMYVKKTLKRNGRRRRSYRRNAFMAQLTSVLKTGLLVFGGFATHRMLTNVALNYVLTSDQLMKVTNQSLANFLMKWRKPLVGLGVAAIGVPLARKFLPRNSTEISAGMVASLFQSTIIAALAAKPTWQGYLQGYNNSRAYALRGPMERNAFSIAPRYATLSGYQQAAAGFQQAAAGFQQAAAGTGEYFSANGVGEYFATNGLQGVGAYEAAGQLALQAAAGADDIDDGIRPDSDIDGLLDLAEAAAGLRGTGEFYTAVKESGGRVVAKRVGEQSQWIPAGPLWAGADFVSDTQDTSELPAGILSSQGGNGTLST